MELINIRDAQFYVANALLILEYLHQKDIVHRDIKPKNFLVDEFGYLTLVDFRTARVLQNRSYTVIGTPHYMAPEIIIGKGYDISVDIWSLGILFYELVCGNVPFGEDLTDIYEIYQSILLGQLSYPSFLYDHNNAKSLIEQMLNKSPQQRGNVEKIKAHKFFTGFSFDSLYSREIEAPYKPQISLDKQKEKNCSVYDYFNFKSKEFMFTENDLNENALEWDQDF